ncbi:MAG TPA: hypothetical protein VGN18_10370 [Jatrophihabitans sp.]|uniref:hypothetical protein n=1 Tax=Jatrophihabitans sp. TaxID=1932789 RepID=UPI002DFEA8A6|nr:hypothetical protein [Jatrophihabitans sp.]
MTTSTGARAFGVRGAAFVVIGGTFVVLAILGLSWYAVEDGADTAGSGFTFADLKANADQLSAPIASAYFDWLAWALLVAVVLVGFAATLPTKVADVLRVLGFFLGVVGVAATFYALAQLFNAQRAAGGSDHGVWHNSTLGTWAALGGFLLAGIGAVLGPRRA